MKRQSIEFLRVGDYAAEVPIELIDDGEGWSPYLSIADAKKLEAVRRALADDDPASAAKFGKIFILTPVS